MNVSREHRHELFAQAIARGLKPHEAYLEAGYSGRGAYQGADRLKRNPQVAARIAELLEENDWLASLTRKEFLSRIDAFEPRITRISRMVSRRMTIGDWPQGPLTKW